MIVSSLRRESTSITISEFHERHQLGKYNFDPRYQRRGDVWDDGKKSFLIDTIIKNFPMPPIFLHQRIDEKTGETLYDIIDGKQRLTAIIDFIDNKVALPQDYDVGPFGDGRLNDLQFNDFVGDLGDFKKIFWKYKLTIEYIDSDDLEIIDNVFDRLNRNGEPLEPQELRKAKYHDALLIKTISSLSESMDWDKLDKIRFNRMQDQEFISELLFFILEKGPTDASEKNKLDDLFEKWAAKFSDSLMKETSRQFKVIVKYMNSLDLNFDEYKIKGVSHFYALFALSDNCLHQKIDKKNVSPKLREFYSLLRSDDSENQHVAQYRQSMQSNTRAKSQRSKRIAALEKFCGIK